MQLAGGWELSLLTLMVLLYLIGAALNPAFFGSADAFHAVLRDTARYGVMAVGMTFVIVNKDLDLSVGSTYGLTGVIFAIIFSPTHLGLGLTEALLACLLLGTFIGLLNGTLVTILKVPAFIATLTMLADRARHGAGADRRQEHRLRAEGQRHIPRCSSSARPMRSASTTRSSSSSP